ncbi:hypothetical protein ACTFIW_003631 [Dictyostelium discoideum]
MSALVGIEPQIKLNEKDASFQAFPVKFTNEQKDFLDNHIKDLLKYGIIRESCSSVSSSIVLRPKPGGTYRMCVNYTKLNNITVKDRYPIPYINEIWNQIKESKFYSKLDMVSGYYQISIRESDKYLTAFSVPQGFYEFNVMPFGLCNAPAVFQRAIYKIFSNENRHTLQSFYDDINLNKCQFTQNQVKFLGHIIYSNEPKNVKEVQRLIGTLNFFRKFVENFAAKIKPLYQLLKNDVEFQWKDSYKSICTSIITKLEKDRIILVYPSSKKPLETDASDIGIGATLSQDNGTQEVLVITDNSTVSFLKNNNGKIRNKRLINWNIKLASYNVTFKYRSGKENVIADALSRSPVEEVLAIIPLGKSIDIEPFDARMAAEQRKDKFLIPIFKSQSQSNSIKSVNRITILQYHEQHTIQINN